MNITGADLYRLASGVQLDPLDVAWLLPVAEGSPPHDAVWLDRTQQAHELCLRKHPRRPKDRHGHRPCNLLMHLHGGASRCGVYGHRPMVCRLYPTVRTDRGVVVSSPPLCPPNAWSIERLDLPTADHVHRLWALDQDIYRGLLRRWNRAAGAVPEGKSYLASFFMSWLLNFYGQLEPHLAPHLASAERQRELLSAWQKASAFGDPPFELVGSSNHHGEVLGLAGPAAGLVVGVRTLLDRQARLAGPQ